MGSSTPPSSNSPPPPGSRDFFRVFPSIMLPVFLAVVDQTIVATALPSIAGDLGHVDDIAWVVIAYLIAVTIAAPVYGRLGDLLGRRRLMLVALAVSAAGSIAAALAPSMGMLLAARALQGLGGGGLLTLTQALIGEAIPPRDRARFQGYLASVALTSNSFGPLVGGLLTAQFGWRSIFLVNLPLAAVAILLVLRLPDRRGERESFRFDGLGLVFFATFTISALVVLQYVQELSFDVMVAGLLILLCGISVLLLVWRERRASTPLFPPRLMRDPTIWRCDALAAFHGGLLVSMITFTPIYFRVVHGVAIAEAGWLLIPVTAGLATGSLVTGRLVGRTGYAAIFPSCGVLVAAGGFVAMAFWASEMHPYAVSALLGFTALFMGTVMGVVQVLVQVSAGPVMLGTAAATVQLSRALGASLGTAIIGAVLFVSVRMADPEAARLMGAILQRGPDVILEWPAASRDLLRGEIAGAFRLGFLAMALFAVTSSLFAWTIPTRRI